MEEIKTKGIVLKATDYADSDKIVTILSYDLGLIRARVRGVKKKGAKLAFAVQPFAFIEFMFVKKGDFYTVVNATSIEQFFELSTDFDSYILMLACLEVCEKAVKENDPQIELFLLLIECFKLVCFEKVSGMIVFIKFMLNAMEILGFAMQVDKCANCGKPLSKNKAFSFEFNGVICGSCQNTYSTLELSEGEYAILKKIYDSKFEDLSKLIFTSRQNLVSIISLLAKDFRIFLDEELSTLKLFL